ncbi:MAG TPA: class II aldolase/adducin family protein [Kofleriaceae bacterium]
MNEVILAARALSRHGLVHAYGHVSARVDANTFIVTGPHPLRNAKDVITCTLTELAPGALPEVRIHQAIYRARPEVGGICRFQSPSVMALSACRQTPRALHGLGTYFAPHPPLWDDPLLVRDDERAAAVASQLGANRAIVLRGNGAVTVGGNVREAACHAFFLEDAAALELKLNGRASTPYTADQAARRANSADKQLYDRMWEFLLGDDYEEVR